MLTMFKHGTAVHCKQAVGGGCSMREAVHAARAASPPSDVRRKQAMGAPAVGVPSRRSGHGGTVGCLLEL